MVTKWLSKPCLVENYVKSMWPLLTTSNVLHPANVAPALLPNEGMVLSLYYTSLVTMKK
ncbi:MAG: hypothetical protein ACTS4V_00030 [Candidatus Hodgkinia cicadicola]